MIKLKDAVEKYGDYEIDEKKLENILVKPKPNTVWDLKDGDLYYYINDQGDIKSSYWGNMDIDHSRRYLGNCFLTIEEVEFEYERRKVEAELLKLGGTRDMMALKKDYKYLIVYGHSTKNIGTDSFSGTNYQGAIFFRTKVDCENAIRKVGIDRIKKYIFNVKE